MSGAPGPLKAAIALQALLLGALLALSQQLGAWSALALYAALFIPYSAALYLAWRRPPLGGPRSLWLFLGAGLLMRLMCLGVEPLLSDDIYRYVWDGRVLLSGVNPYRYAPVDEALRGLRDAQIWPKINHPALPTIYPPVAQYLFGLNALIGGGVVALKALMVGVELACVGLFGRFIARDWTVERKQRALLLYWLHPLVIVELAWSGHVDVLAYGPLVLALGIAWRWPAQWRALLGAGALLGLSIAAKLLGIIALPLLLFAPLRGEGLRRVMWQRAGLLLATLLIVAGSYLPLRATQGSKTGSLATYAASWRNNDGLYRAMHQGSLALLETMAAPSQRLDPRDPTSQVFLRFDRYNALALRLGITKQYRGETIPNTAFVGDQIAQTVAKLMAAFLMGLLLLWCLLVIRAPQRGALWLFFGLYLCAPTVMPWYVAWLVPMSALHTRRAPLLFSALCLLGYVSWASSRSGGQWAIPWWVVTLEFGAVILAALVELLRVKPSGSEPVERPIT